MFFTFFLTNYLNKKKTVVLFFAYYAGVAQFGTASALRADFRKDISVQIRAPAFFLLFAPVFEHTRKPFVFSVQRSQLRCSVESGRRRFFFLFWWSCSKRCYPKPQHFYISIPTKRAMIGLYILAAAGFLLSLYSYFIDKKVAANKKYKAACDIADNMSCTDAAKSKYAAVGGVLNSVKGMIFYPLLAFLTFLGFSSLVFFLAVGSVLMTFYLAYASYIKLKNYCLICTSIYLVNLAIFLASYSWHFLGACGWC